MFTFYIQCPPMRKSSTPFSCLLLDCSGSVLLSHWQQGKSHLSCPESWDSEAVSRLEMLPAEILFLWVHQTCWISKQLPSFLTQIIEQSAEKQFEQWKIVAHVVCWHPKSLRCSGGTQGIKDVDKNCLMEERCVIDGLSITTKKECL